MRSLFLYILRLRLGLFIPLSAHVSLTLSLPMALHLLTLVCRQQGVKKRRQLHNKQLCNHCTFALSSTDLHHPFSGVTAKLRWCVYIRISAIKNLHHITHKINCWEGRMKPSPFHDDSICFWSHYLNTLWILQNLTKFYCVCCPRLTPASEVNGGKVSH